MHAPYGLEPIDSCEICRLKGNAFFRQLPPAAVKEMDDVQSSATYPARAVLYMEQQEPRGVFVLCSGKVKLSISSSTGKALITRLADPGEVLGLMATMSGSPYEVTAETVHPSQAMFVRRDDFLRLVAKYPEMQQAVIKELGKLYSSACEQLRTVGLAASAREKLARLLLGWCVDGKQTKQGTQITVPFTHEEIAEFAGITRETVTRILSEFKAKHLLTLQGSTLRIANRAALKNFATV
jgi:CRP/FNR family transcriptional regulator, cyclic AMP receptor protein